MGWIPCSGKSSGRTKTRRNADQKLNRKSSDCSVSTSDGIQLSYTSRQGNRSFRKRSRRV
ncbi:unnamed protein product [Arabidopsis halleri]